MLAGLLLQEIPRRREQRSVAEARLDGFVGRAERDLGPGQVGTLACDRGLDVNGGIEEDRPLDEVGMTGRELGDELAAEAVTEPGGAGDPERRRGLDEIGDVLLHAPRRLPSRAAMAPVVDSDHATIGEPLLSEPTEPAPVTGDAVEADDRRARRIAPLDGAQPHESTSLPKCRPASRASSAVAASTRGKTESITGRQLPVWSERRRPAKSSGLPIIVPSSENCPK